MKAMLPKGKNQPLVLDIVPDPVPGSGEAVACGDLWLLVTEKLPFAEAEAVHPQLEAGPVTGRAALLMP